jgi:release factor glutamine methyltransferase
VFAEQEVALLCTAASTAPELEAMIAQRAGGVPLEHVVGWAQFCGLRIAVDTGVFIPRRRTELLVRQAAAAATRAGVAGARSVVVVDLCCGAGAVAAAVAAAVSPMFHHVDLVATDIDPRAVACARRNLATIGGRVYQGDLYGALPPDLRGHIDVLVANVPYVPTSEIALLPTEARLHEDTVALDGGADGLDVLRTVAAAAPMWLAPGGELLIETSARQEHAARMAFTSTGLRPKLATDSELDATVVIGNVRRRRRGGVREVR